MFSQLVLTRFNLNLFYETRKKKRIRRLIYISKQKMVDSILMCVFNGHLMGNFENAKSTTVTTGGFPSQKFSNVELWCFRCYWHEQAVDQTTVYDVRRHDATVSVTHYNDVITGAMAPRIISPMIVNSAVYSGAYQSKHQSSASLGFVRGIHRWPVNSPHKWSVTRKMFPLDDVIMTWAQVTLWLLQY